MFARLSTTDGTRSASKLLSALCALRRPGAPHATARRAPSSPSTTTRHRRGRAGREYRPVAAQPLAVEQLRQGRFGAQLRAPQPLHRFAVEAVGGGTGGEERPAASVDAQSESV